MKHAIIRSVIFAFGVPVFFSSCSRNTVLWTKVQEDIEWKTPSSNMSMSQNLPPDPKKGLVPDRYWTSGHKGLNALNVSKPESFQNNTILRQEEGKETSMKESFAELSVVSEQRERDEVISEQKTFLSHSFTAKINLSKSDRKILKKKLREAVKKNDETTNTLLLVIITILIPPLGVALAKGVRSSQFWIDLILTLLFYVPGLIYGLIVILSND